MKFKQENKRKKINLKIGSVDYSNTMTSWFNNEDFWGEYEKAVFFCERFETFRQEIIKTKLFIQDNVIKSFSEHNIPREDITSFFCTNIKEVDIMKLFLSNNDFYNLNESQRDFVEETWFFAPMLQDALGTSENAILGF